MQVRYQAALRPGSTAADRVVKGVNANAIHWVCQSICELRIALETIHPRLEFLPRPESHHPSGSDGDFLPGFGIASGTLILFTQVKIAEPGQFDLMPRSKALRISSKKISTNSLASRLLMPSSSNNRSAISAFVSAML
jgi:hypothetical protein